jgi:hypothetical protein
MIFKKYATFATLCALELCVMESAMPQTCLVQLSSATGGYVATDRFGIRRENTAHAGQDIRSAKGDKLYAGADGTVAYIGVMGGGGNTFVIKLNNGDHINYMHMSSYADRFKDRSNKEKDGTPKKVKAGELIGYAGGTNYKNGALTASGKENGGYTPHLHFEYGIQKSSDVKDKVVSKNDIKNGITIRQVNGGNKHVLPHAQGAAYRTDPAPYYCNDIPFKTDPSPPVPFQIEGEGKLYLGKSVREQYNILYNTNIPGTVPGSPQQVAAAAQQKGAEAAGKPVEDWLSDTDGSGSLPLPSFGDYADMSPIQMLLTEAQRRFVDANWQSNLSKVSSRALWADYVRMTAVDNYLREASLRKQERIEALWAAYLALKLKPGDAAVKASAQKVLADHARSRIQ